MCIVITSISSILYLYSCTIYIEFVVYLQARCEPFEYSARTAAGDEPGHHGGLPSPTQGQRE